MIRRQRELLLYLMESNIPIIGQDLADKFNVSLRTIRSDISKINDELKYYNTVISASKEVGYYFEDEKKKILFKNKEYINMIAKFTVLDLPENSQERAVYILFRMCSDNIINLQDIEEELYTTRSTLNQDLNKLNYLIKNKFFKLSIEQEKNNRLFLNGSEEAKRDLISGIFSQTRDDVLLTKYTNYIFDIDFKNIHTYVYELLGKLEKEKEDKLTGNGLRSLAFDIVISYYRNNLGFKIDLDGNCTLKLNWTDLLKNELDKKLILLTIKDYYFLEKRYNSKSFLVRKNYKSNIKLNEIINEFEYTLKEMFNINLYIDFIEEELKPLVNCIIFRLENGYYYDEYFKDSLFYHDPFSFILSSILGDIINFYINIPIDENNLYLIASLLSTYLRDNYSLIDIYLISNNDKGYCINLSKMLSRESNNRIKIIDFVTSINYFINKSSYEKELMIVNSSDFQFYDNNNIHLEKLPITKNDISKIEDKFFEMKLSEIKQTIKTYSYIYELSNIYENLYQISKDLGFTYIKIKNMLDIKIYRIDDSKIIIPYIDNTVQNVIISECLCNCYFRNKKVNKIIILQIGKINYQTLNAILNKLLKI